jgi:hypothetical protein
MTFCVVEINELSRNFPGKYKESFLIAVTPSFAPGNEYTVSTSANWNGSGFDLLLT